MNDMLQECADTIELLNGEKEQFQLKLNLASSELVCLKYFVNLPNLLFS